MQRIEEKRIDNSSLVPTRIAEETTTWRQPKPVGLDMSGLSRAFKAVGGLVNTISNEFEKADREMDELANIKVNALFKNQQIAAISKLDGMPLSRMQNEVGRIREDYTANIRKALEDIPMTSGMRERVNANLLGKDEEMKIRLDAAVRRKQADYIINEHIGIYKNALENFDGVTARAERQHLLDLGVNVKETEADINSREAFGNLRQGFDNNDFSYIQDLKATGKDGKFSKFKELKYDDRMKLIRYGKQKQASLQNENFNKYLNMAVDGKDFTIEQIKSMHEKGGLADSSYRSLIQGKQAKNYENIVYELSNVDDDDNFDDNIAGYQRIIESEFEAGNISEKQYNSLNSAIKSGNAEVQAARIGRELENAKARNDYAFKKVQAEIMSMDMPHANDTELVRARIIDKINDDEEYGFNLDQKLKLLELLEKKIQKDDPLEKSPIGTDAKVYINKIFAEMEADKKLDQNRVGAWKYDALFIARQMIKYPSMTLDQIKDKINQTIKLAVEKEVPRLINPEYRAINPEKYGKLNEKTTTWGNGPARTWGLMPMPRGKETFSYEILREYPHPENKKVVLIDVKLPSGKILKGEYKSDYQEIKEIKEIKK